MPGAAVRAVIWSIVVLFAVVAMLPFGGLLLGDAAVAQGQPDTVNERASFWRAVRGGVEGYSAIKSQGANVLIQNGGENWRALRNGPVKTWGSWLLAASLASIALFFLIRGRIRIEGGPDGATVPRWNVFERFLHWYTAILFLVLLVTGLSMLYGREVMIPVLGKDAFSAYASLMRTLHNYLGPFFTAGLVVELLLWLPHNIPRRVDLVWLVKGGGLVGKAHLSAGRMNGGEKIWYWLLFLVGLAVAATGLAMDFPNLDWTREQMQVANLIHVTGGIILMCFAFGHIYIGTLGTEGALQGMTTGRVDVQWAKQHHDLWYQELVDKEIEAKPATNRTGAGQTTGVESTTG